MTSIRRGLLGIDTSVAVPLLVRTHPAHDTVHAWLSARRFALCGHAEVETFSVLTRLPGDLRLDGPSVVRLMTEGFAAVLRVDPAHQQTPALRIAACGAVGGAVYDALVALAAVDADVTLVTRDARALPTYRQVGADVAVIA